MITVNRTPLLPLSMLLPAVFLAMAGCSSATNETVSANASTATHSRTAALAARTAAQTNAADADLVTAVAQSESTVPFTLRFRLTGRPVVGQTVSVELVVEPAADAAMQSWQLDFLPGDAVRLPDGAQWKVEGAAASAIARREIELIPTAAGVQELGVSASVQTQAGALTQSWSIPLIVATGG